MELVFLLVDVVVEVVVLAVGVVALVMQICPNEPANILSFFAVDVLHAPQSVCVKDDAEANMRFM